MLSDKDKTTMSRFIWINIGWFLLEYICKKTFNI